MRQNDRETKKNKNQKMLFITIKSKFNLFFKTDEWWGTSDMQIISWKVWSITWQEHKPQKYHILEKTY